MTNNKTNNSFDLKLCNGMNLQMQIEVVYEQNGEIKKAICENFQQSGDENKEQKSEFKSGARLNCEIKKIGSTYEICNEITSEEEIQVQSLSLSFKNINEKIDLTKYDQISFPYDNDCWVRFENNNIQKARESFDIAVLHKDDVIAIGAATFKNFKTILKYENDKFEIVQGSTSKLTRDEETHGKVTGKTIKFEKMLIINEKTYEKAMLEYSNCCQTQNPPLWSQVKVPFGWNSFSAFPANVEVKNYEDAVNFLDSCEEIKSNFSDSLFANYDFAPRIDKAGILKSKEIASKKNLKSGFYIAPFVVFNDYEKAKAIVLKDGKTMYDILLRNSKGEILPEVDNLLSLDPTDDDNIERVINHLKDMAKEGYSYVKLDFLAHASREGVYCAKQITTGRQAYNYAMTKIVKAATELGIFISSSISPIFPYEYANARRICCDAFGTLEFSEYALNSLTYVYFMHNNLYQYNDADHVVLEKSFKHSETSFEEAKTRAMVSIISGGVIMLSDDYSSTVAQTRAKKFFDNKEVCELLKKGMSFKPMYFPRGDKSCEVFNLKNDNKEYFAFFNLYQDEMTFDLTKYADLKKYKKVVEIIEDEPLGESFSLKKGESKLMLME